MILVSVIVPVYKVEDYLRKCVDSILVQTYKNLEIILVDDGSPDNCGAICDEYALLDGRVKVIHKENGGLSDARNAGLDVCTGEYIAFVDSDDWVDEDYIATFMEYAQPDTIVCCGYKIVYKNKIYYNTMDKVHFFMPVEIIETQLFQELNASIGISKVNPIGNYAWNKLYPRAFFNDIRYPIRKSYEDIFIAFDLFKLCKKFVVLPVAKYNYLVRETSICGNPSKKSMYDYLEARQKQLVDVKNLRKLEMYAQKLELTGLIGIFVNYKKEAYCLDEEEIKYIKDSMKAYQSLVSTSDGKIWLKYQLILHNEFLLKMILMIRYYLRKMKIIE